MTRSLDLTAQALVSFFLFFASSSIGERKGVYAFNNAGRGFTHHKNLHNALSSSARYFILKPEKDLEGEDKDGNIFKIPRKKIKRDWSFDGYTATGEMTVDFFLPEVGEIKGCAFFMHGFSQYPIAYCNTLQKSANNANVAIIAVETGVTDDIVLRNLVADGKRLTPPYVLQRAISNDTKQLIRMLLADEDDIFKEYGIARKFCKNKIAVMGHSMGGGLSYAVAADFHQDVEYVFTMAPVGGETPFEPVPAIEKSVVKNSMMLNGEWDLIAGFANRPLSVEKFAEASNNKEAKSCIYVDVNKGLHTGFQDRVVLFGIPLQAGLGLFGLIWNIFGFAEIVIFNVLQIFLAILALNKKRTGQLAGTQVLMDYFLESMVDCKPISIERAEDYFNDKMGPEVEKNFELSYPLSQKE